LKGEKEKMASITIKGAKYDLLFDMWALEQIESEFGGVKKMYDSLRGGDGTVNLSKAMATVFRILANSARDAAGLTTNVTGDEVRHVSVGKLTEAVHAAINEGMKAETQDGNEADDEVHDEYLEEIEKNV
jgi:hypothetical protein